MRINHSNDASRAARVTSIVASLAVILLPIAASTHHSFAIFDHTRTYTLQGIVRSFQWTNPHGYIELDVTQGPEGLTQFTLELTSINMLRRSGWRSNDLAPGDQVTVVTAPLLDGQPGGLLLEIETGDGRTLVPPVPAIESFKRTP